MSDPITIVERAYAHVPDDRTWLHDLGRALLPCFEAEFGVLGYLLDVASPGRCTSAPVVVSGPDWLASDWRLLHDDVDRAFRESGLPAEVRLYDPARCAATLSEVYGKHLNIRDVPAFRTAWMARGIQESVVIVALDATGRGCAFAVPLAEPARLAPGTRRMWQRMSAHIAAAFRLRQAAPSDGDQLTQAAETEAILTPDGRVLDARGDARAPSGLGALREAARRVDRARSSLGRREPDEALSIWTALIAGRWSLIDHFESDGRRLLIARRNDQRLSDPRALSERERVVVTYAAMGYANKRIGYELGLSTSTVGNHLARGMRKLGIESRVELVRLLGMMARKRSERAPRERRQAVG
jgi:DNA-binding CsgD family transcriptional regulator